MKKQILAILLAVTLMMGVAVPAAADNISQIIGDGNTVVFVDVPTSYWAANEIKYFASQGIINGKPDGTFAPTEGVTREAFAKMLVLTFRAPLTTPATPSFMDVAADRWSYAYIEVAKDFLTGYVSPFDGSMSYHPEEEATREDIAVALVRMLGLTGADAKNPNYASAVFDDGSEITPSLLPYVSLAVERGLITGFEDHSYGYRRMLFAPQKSISRAETVVMLNRASKQAVADGTAELKLSAQTVYDKDGDDVTLYISADEGTAVSVDGTAVTMERDGSTGGYAGAYTYHFDAEGTKVFTVTATKLGKTKTIQVNAQYQIGGPKLTITQCPTDVTDKDITIEGTLTDSNYGVSLTINGASVPVSSWRGEWSKSCTLTEGENTFTIVGKNEAGKTVTETRTVNLTIAAPTFYFYNCPETTTSQTVSLVGRVTDDYTPVRLFLNDQALNVDYRGDFTKEVSLVPGENVFTFRAVNAMGKETIETKTVVYQVEDTEPVEDDAESIQLP